jgi:hypothetical protein
MQAELIPPLQGLMSVFTFIAVSCGYALRTVMHIPSLQDGRYDKEINSSTPDSHN